MDAYTNNNHTDKCLGQTLPLVVTLELQARDLCLGEFGNIVPQELIPGNQGTKPEYANVFLGSKAILCAVFVGHSVELVLALTGERVLCVGGGMLTHRELIIDCGCGRRQACPILVGGLWEGTR